MDEKTLSWGMIGVGNVTEVKSAPSFNKIGGSRLVAVGNRTPEKAKQYAARHQVSAWHRDPRDVISDPGVDIVYIATPPGSHREYALECIRAGKPVYIEKPMALNWPECREINEAAGKKGVAVYVAYYRRSLAYFLKVKEIIESGRLGRTLQVHLQQYFVTRPEDLDKDNPPWRVIPEISGGGYFHDVGCHALDILFYIFGDPEGATGTFSNIGGLYRPEDTLSVSMELTGGLQVSGAWNFIAPEAYQKDRVEVLCEKGNLSFSIFSFDPITMTTSEGTEEFSPPRPPHIQMPLIKTIVAAELHGGACPSTGPTAAVTSRVMDQILSDHNVDNSGPGVKI